MKVWIITTGSSDVQLKVKTNWQSLFSKVRGQLDSLRNFTPIGETEPFTVPARVMGVVYSQPDSDQHFEDLTFPLLDNFKEKIVNEEIDQIILIMTDQHEIFSRSEKQSPQSPFWQDTCTLITILEKYFRKNFSEVETISSIILKPSSGTKGLDDWNSVFKLVQEKFSLLNFPEDTIIYMSHQAGTPAISSAVQFSSLAKFGQQVKFLVSSARDKKSTYILDSSAYLKGLQLQEAKALLARFDYVGVKKLISSHLSDESNKLLDALIEWNYAKFDNFADLVKEFIGDRIEQWWWTAYEAAYLSEVRHSQGNIVDSFFHGFRAVEGAFSEWGKHEFKNHVKEENERPLLQFSILADSKDYFVSAKFKKDGSPNNSLAELKMKLQEIKDGKIQKKLILFGEVLYPLFRSCREDYKSKCPSLSQFWDSNNGIAERRNIIFHQLKGLTELELYNSWKVNNWDYLELKILDYLNYITENDFQSLKEASLMTQVHQELESAIAQLSIS